MSSLICILQAIANWGGRKKTEELLPQLEQDISNLVDTHSQADPKFKSTFSYTKISARAVKEALISEKGYQGKRKKNRAVICYENPQ
ncbi:hypothetical protein IQ255_21730 [Pleurocapsales cyanobacterium LEGE 10410]|nr:hypothetical protein [Pleurocapsales cyanobacterium LEGE 10410]